MRHPSSTASVGLLFWALIATGAAAESTGTERYNADIAASHLTVEGTSTLHHWKVEGEYVGGYMVFSENELTSLWGNTSPPPQPLATTVRVEIPVTSLKSDKRGMDQTMYKTLKARAHPTITYRLESAKITTRQTAQADDADGSITIDTKGVLTMAGAEQTVDIPMQVKRLSHDRLEVSGEISLRMTDFGLDPPIAMLGMLHTGDMVHVHWTWVLAPSSIDHRDEW